MDCREFEDRLQGLLQGELTSLARSAAEEHAARCAACRELLAIARDSLEALSALGLPFQEDAPDLTSAVLARTSGPACRRAQEQLGDLVDGVLQEAEAELVSLHVAHCAPCRALRDTLVWLAPELCAMTALEPDTHLVGDVLRATAALRQRRMSRRISRHMSRRSALAAWWDRLAERPRFAWEAAYAGTLALALLCGTPHSPWRGAPARALATVQMDPARLYEEATAEVRGFRDGAVAAGVQAWSAVGGPVFDRAEEATTGFASRHRPAALALADLRLHGRELLRAACRADLAACRLFLGALGHDVQRLWQSRTESSPTGTSAPNPPGARCV